MSSMESRGRACPKQREKNIKLQVQERAGTGGRAEKGDNEKKTREKREIPIYEHKKEPEKDSPRGTAKTMGGERGVRKNL